MEVVGFEPTDPCGSLVFKTRTINRSATLPQTSGGLHGAINTHPLDETRGARRVRRVEMFQRSLARFGSREVRDGGSGYPTIHPTNNDGYDKDPHDLRPLFVVPVTGFEPVTP